MTLGGGVPLSMIHAGQTVIIVKMNGGYRFVNRMKEMGFVIGEKIQLLSSGYSGPVRVKVKGCTFAIGHGIAHKIMVI